MQILTIFVWAFFGLQVVFGVAYIILVGYLTGVLEHLQRPTGRVPQLYICYNTTCHGGALLHFCKKLPSSSNFLLLTCFRQSHSMFFFKNVFVLLCVCRCLIFGQSGIG